MIGDFQLVCEVLQIGKIVEHPPQPTDLMQEKSLNALLQHVCSDVHQDKLLLEREEFDADGRENMDFSGKHNWGIVKDVSQVTLLVWSPTLILDLAVQQTQKE